MIDDIQTRAHLKYYFLKQLCFFLFFLLLTGPLSFLIGMLIAGQFYTSHEHTQVAASAGIIEKAVDLVVSVSSFLLDGIYNIMIFMLCVASMVLLAGAGTASLVSGRLADRIMRVSGGNNYSVLRTFFRFYAPVISGMGASVLILFINGNLIMVLLTYFVISYLTDRSLFFSCFLQESTDFAKETE